MGHTFNLRWIIYNTIASTTIGLGLKKDKTTERVVFKTMI
jgi:hypothetical protein